MKFFLSIVSMLLVCQAAQADAAQDLVTHFLNNVHTLQARFEQSLIAADGQVTETSHGKLDLERPGRFRWEYTEPYRQVLVADGLNLWSYDIDLAQVTVKPQDKALGNTPALLLGGAASALQQFAVDGSFDEDGLTWVRMKPKEADSGFTSMELGFANSTLQRMNFVDNLGQKTVVQLQDVVIDKPIADSEFQFQPPKGVDVVGTPAGDSSRAD